MSFDLEPNDEQKALRETLHEFAAEVLRPAARPCESARVTSDDVARQVHEIGVAAPVDERYGGGGTFDAVTYCIAAEELAWGDPGIAYQVLASGLASIVIGKAGTDEQRATVLPSFAGTDPAPTFVATGEKVAAGDFATLETNIDDDKVTGEKYGVVDAATARLGVVVGRKGGELAAAIIERESFEVIAPEEKMGLEAAPTWIVRFDGPAQPLPPGPDLERALLWGKLLVGAVAVGCARASSEYAAQYARERTAFGKPIGAFQGISFKIADMAIEVDAARLALWRAAWSIERGEAEAGDAAQALGQTLGAAIRCGDDAVQILGGHGYVRDHPVEKWFRDAVTLSVFDSPDLLGDLAVARAGQS